MSDGLRLLVFDRTCHGPAWRPGLSRAWSVGARLYRGMGRLDATYGAGSWDQALAWLESVAPDAPIAEIQFWGHGRWGQVLIGSDVLDARAVQPDHRHHPALVRVRARLVPDGRALWWFRTCETFGTQAGHDFARAWTNFFGCPAAGHTRVIGVWQSGLRCATPGQAPTWSVDEGLVPGAPPRAAGSWPWLGDTVSCLHGRLPAATRKTWTR